MNEIMEMQWSLGMLSLLGEYYLRLQGKVCLQLLLQPRNIPSQPKEVDASVSFTRKHENLFDSAIS